MYAARYWASAHIEAKDPRGRTEFRSVWRGSNESPEDAARLAFVDVDRPKGSTRVGLFARLLRRSTPAPDLQGLRSRLSAWVGGDRSRGARVYETAAGLRYMIVNPHMDPCGDATHDLMTRLGADRVYQRLCKSQKCFRARLRPKPWRIVMESVRIGPGVFAQEDTGVERWLRDYESRGSGFGVCRVVEEIGNLEPPDEASERLMALHDEHTVRDPGVPLA